MVTRPVRIAVHRPNYTLADTFPLSSIIKVLLSVSSLLADPNPRESFQLSPAQQPTHLPSFSTDDPLMPDVRLYFLPVLSCAAARLTPAFISPLPYRPQIAQRFLKDRKGHDKAAREWTGALALQLAFGWLGRRFGGLVR